MISKQFKTFCYLPKDFFYINLFYLKLIPFPPLRAVISNMSVTRDLI